MLELLPPAVSGSGAASAWLCAALVLACCSSAQAVTVKANCVVEVRLATKKLYADPFNEVELDALVTQPDGKQLRIPAFWDGGSRWCFRFSSGSVGKHVYRTECSDRTNPDLHGVEGEIEVAAYDGGNPLYQHGSIRVAGDRRHFEHADGTPFFWLGDTWWKGLCKRIPWEGFRRLTADRKAKGFTVVQIVAGPYPDEPPFDPRWANEGGMPYENDYARVNPAYFHYADRRIEHLIDQGIVPAIVGGWGWHMPSIGVEKMKKHWRYLIARYGAYPVIWIVGGEAGGPEWTNVARYVRSADPYGRPATAHPHTSGRQSLTDDTVLDFDMLQTGHGDWANSYGSWSKAAANTVSKVTSHYSKTPAMPVLVGEVCYEGHMMTNGPEVQRQMFWSSILSGAAGHTYGAGGIWQMNSETVRGAEYELTAWFEAMKLPGSAQLGLAKRLLEEYPWWRFEPHPDWVEPHSTALSEPHDQWYDDNQQFAARGGRWDLPYAAGIPGEVRFVYIPGHYYDWSSPTIKRLEPDATYHAYYWDPATAKRYDLGTIVRPSAQPAFFSDDFENGDASAWKDYGTASRRQGGRLVGRKGMVTVIEKVDEVDLTAAATARSDAEAGIVLRFHNPDSYLVGVYSPLLKAIFIHDRKNAEYGPQLGMVSVPEIGPDIRLTMSAWGNYAALAVTDGKNTYCTPSVKVGNTTPGKAGVWLFQVGERQQFDNFGLSRLTLAPIKSKARGLPLVLNENPGILPAVEVPEISLLTGDDYTPPRLPAPQDWVLVLERVRP